MRTTVRSASRAIRQAALGLLAALLAGCSSSPSTEAPPPVQPVADRGDLTERVHAFCGACHAYPPANTFPRSAWKGEVERGYDFFGKSHRRLAAPLIDDVVRYYEEQAPPAMTLPKFDYSATPLAVSFTRAHFPEPTHADPPAISNVNLVHLFDPKRLDVLACDMRRGQVLALRPCQDRPTWQVLGAVSHPAHAEVVDLDRDGIADILVANLGSFKPTDRRVGSVVWLRGRGDGTFMPFTLLDGVGRVADVQAADFNGDGKTDLVVAVFGWNETGEIRYLENRTTDWSKPTFAQQILDERHGTIHVSVADLNGDGKPDFVALISQEHETVVAFLNELDGAGGRFRKETIYAAPHPGYGSSGIELKDLDGDGDLDVLYTNGDVLDQPYFLKPYHTVQWLENPGSPAKGVGLGFPFKHHHLATMYGVHRAVAADVDGDGDLDVVAVSFLPEEGFPQRKQQGLDAVIVLEQTEPGRFTRFRRHALEKGSCDHVTCAAGDVFGTGRTDLVIGNFISTPIEHALTLWKNQGRATSKR
jgi:hypothetical protein